MQKCKRCGQDLPDDARICLFCGQPVESEDEEQRRRLMLRWHLGAVLQGMKRPTSGFPFSLAHPIATTGQQLPVAIVVFLISIVVLSNIILVGFLESRNRSPIVITFPLPPPSVSPALLDFGQVEAGGQAVLPVIVKTNSDSGLTWGTVSRNAQWLSITLRTEEIAPDHSRQVVYNVTANTSKLHVGPYSETLSVRSDGGKEQRIDVKILVTSVPQPAKLNVNPPVLDFGSQKMGSQKILLLTVSNTGGGELSWTADKGEAPWLTLDTSAGKIASGGPPHVIKVKVDTSALTVGLYPAVINFTSNGGSVAVDVRLSVVSTQTSEQGPVVSSVSPNSGPATGDTPVTIMGTNFTGATKVSFGSTEGTIVSVSDTQIIATSPAGSGTVDVTVTTPVGISDTSTADLFNYIPVVTGISPKCVLLPSGITIDIFGYGFNDATKVSFGSTAATTFTINSDTKITSTIPTGSGTVDVRVTTPGGTSPISSGDKYVYPPPPVVKGINPNSGPENGGTSVTIYGIYFTCASSVKFGSTAASNPKVVSDTQIIATSPAGTGTVDVIATNPGGDSASRALDLFTYIPRPIVKNIIPMNGPVAGGTEVKIIGSHFTGATSVSFGTTTANVFYFISDSQIIAISPAGCGIVHVTVTTPGGTSDTSTADQFTYVPSTPVVAYIEPYSGPANGGTAVTISGSGFMCASSVKFGSTEATTFTINSDTQITATSPAGSGTVDVTVTTSSGTSDMTYDDQFTYIPVVTGINPPSGPYAGGTQIIITGFGFTGAMKVFFGSTEGTIVSVSDTQITAISPAASVTCKAYCNPVHVRVMTPGGTSAPSAADLFTYY